MSTLQTSNSWKQRFGLVKKHSSEEHPVPASPTPPTSSRALKKTVTATYDIHARPPPAASSNTTAQDGVVATPPLPDVQGPVVCQVAALSKAGKEPDINPKINQDAWLTTWLTIPLTDFGQHAAQQQRQQQQGRQQEHPSTINTTHVHVNATAHATASAAAGGAAGFNKQDVFHCMVFGVMDGHGPEGHHVSSLVKTQLPERIATHIQAQQGPPSTTTTTTTTTTTAAAAAGSFATHIASYMHQAFVDTDKAAVSSIDCTCSGSTAVLTILHNNTLYTSWVGDSKAVLGSSQGNGQPMDSSGQAMGSSGQPIGKPQSLSQQQQQQLQQQQQQTPQQQSLRFEAVPLTIDHKPDLPEERSRILAHQGRVERLQDDDGSPMGPWRVWFRTTWAPGLAMSRAIGDALAKHVGVIAEPQHSSLQVTPTDRFLILASDGVWEFMTPQQAVDLVGQCATPQDACTKLVEEARKRWHAEEDDVADDITAVVVFFQHTPTAPC